MRLVPNILLPVGKIKAVRLLNMVDHTIIYRTDKNKRKIRNVEREAIKVVNGEQSTALICKRDIYALEDLYRSKVEACNV